jgi:CHAT domain-containing protein/Tfp pilus assembly protein PilF
LACRHRDSPRVAFEKTYTTFLHGHLQQSQEQAAREYERVRESSPEWAWKFRLLEAKSLLWRGNYIEMLALFNAPPARPGDKELLIELLALKGAAHARLHEFQEADENLGEAAQLCQAIPPASCGDVLASRGVLATQQGQTASAKDFFEQSLQFARARNDRFLEIGALLNLGYAALRSEHYDEAIDWSERTYQASTEIGADDIAQTALGNLGWAYYNLGDSERSLELSLDAEQRATRVGDRIDQLSWITNAGYVYAAEGDLGRAKQSYREALDLATKLNGKGDEYNALRALALVSIESDETEQARQYADQAFRMANSDKNRSDELYPLLVEGLIAAKTSDRPEAERLFREVEQDEHSSASLKWRAEHGLAQLYEEEKRPDEADREYRSALGTFETARSSLKRNDARLPFSSNVSRIYDDYLHFLIAHNRPDEALRWAEYNRARMLADGLGSLPKKASIEPPPLNSQEISRRSKSVILFYWLGSKDSILWAVTPDKTHLFSLPGSAEIETTAARYRKALENSQDVLDSGNDDGRKLYDMLVAPAQNLLSQQGKITIIPDGKLNDLNFETLLVSDPKPHYWIDDVTIANASSLRVLSRPAVQNRDRSRNLLLFGNTVSPSNEYADLPNAATEMASIERHFPADQRHVFQGARATVAAYLTGNPEQFYYIHFVTHATAVRSIPLDSAIILSADNAKLDSFKLYARDIIQHPIRADLVTISSCYSAGARSYSGEGLVGLSWAFLRAGAHNVVAALWDASDLSTGQLMDKFYDGLSNGNDPETALRLAKLSLLHSQNSFRKPFYWGPFQLYVGS